MKLPKFKLKLDFSTFAGGKFSGFFSVFKVLSTASSREPFLARLVILIVLASIFSVGGTFYFLKKLQLSQEADHSQKTLFGKEGEMEEYEAVEEGEMADESVAEGHGEVGEHEDAAHGEESAHGEHGEVAEHEGGHGGESEEILESSPLPEEIVKRQNGIPAAGYDLKEPQGGLLRDLASAKNSDLEVRVGNYFVSLDTIYSNARVGNRTDGALVVELMLEMNNYAGREEVNSRKEELRAIVNSLLFEFQKEELLEYEGKMALKRKVQTEINHKLNNGKVIDVLLSEIHMRP